MSAHLVTSAYCDDAVNPRSNVLVISEDECREPDADPVSADAHSVLGLVDLLLKAPSQVDQLNRDPARLPELMPRFLGIALAAYTAFAAVMMVIFSFAPTEARPHLFIEMPAFHWFDGTALAIWPAYALGMVLASCICLPSFYFYGLLAGVKLSFAQVVAIVLRSKAAGAVFMLGLLPIYFAWVLGLVIFHANASQLELLLLIGLGLPFIGGLMAVQAIYRGVLGYADTLPADRRCRRECFLRRLTLAWSVVYSAVAPVMIYRLWWWLAG